MELLSLEECYKVRERLTDSFKDLVFIEDTHQYFLDKKQLPSVSKLITYFHEHFDEEGVGYDYAIKRGFNPEQVISAWRGHNIESTTKGHKVHKFGEDYAYARYFYSTEPLLPTSIQELGIVQWWIDYVDKFEYLFPIKLELQMFSRKYGYAGTADILLLDRRNGKLIIADYKSNRDIFKPTWNKMLHSFKDYKDMAYYHYILQLSFYQIMLEEAGFECGGRVLVWLEKDIKTKKLYQNFKLPYVGHILKNYLTKDDFLSFVN